MKWVHYTKSQSVAAQLVKEVQDDQAIARSCLLKMISTLQFLACQGLAARGHLESEGNFIQLLRLRSEEDCSDLVRWLKRRGNWTSHEIQNELFEIMAHSVLRTISNAAKVNNIYS